MIYKFNIDPKLYDKQNIIDVVEKNYQSSDAKVLLFRRNIDVISHVLPRFKNRIRTSFRIGFLHEIINPFFYILIF